MMQSRKIILLTVIIKIKILNLKSYFKDNSDFLVGRHAASVLVQELRRVGSVGCILDVRLTILLSCVLVKRTESFGKK